MPKWKTHVLTDSFPKDEHVNVEAFIYWSTSTFAVQSWGWPCAEKIIILDDTIPKSALPRLRAYCKNLASVMNLAGITPMEVDND